MSEMKIENGVLIEINEELKSVTIPIEVKEIDIRALVACFKLKSIDVEDGNPNFCSVNGVLFTKDMKTLVKYPLEKKDTEYVIPEGVEVVGEYAFVCNNKIKKITMSDSVKKICDHSFASCHELESITLSENLEEIDKFALANGNVLKKILIPKSVKYIGEYAFSNNLHLEVIVIPENVEMVADYTFCNCSWLKHVFIKSAKTIVKKKAFSGNRTVKIYVPDDYPLEQCEVKNVKSLNKNCKKFWNDAIENVEPLPFRSYLEELKPVSMENNVVIFTIPNGTLPEKFKIYEMFTKKYNRHVREILAETTGEEWEVKIQ